jgi:hypothetical protein
VVVVAIFGGNSGKEKGVMGEKSPRSKETFSLIKLIIKFVV